MSAVMQLILHFSQLTYIFTQFLIIFYLYNIQMFIEIYMQILYSPFSNFLILVSFVVLPYATNFTLVPLINK